MIPRLKPQLGWRELAAAFSATHSDDLQRFEQAFADKVGQKHAVAFPYGRTGLALLLEALGLKGAEIICPAYTCVVVPHAVVVSGNEPVFVDSQQSDFNMNLDLAIRAINDRTGALIATSIFGYPVDLDKLDEISKRYPYIHIIHDCAHSFMAEWQGSPVHKAGIAAFFGLNISKLITSIFGGMVTTDDERLARGLKDVQQRLQRPGWLRRWQRRVYLAAVYLAFSSIGYAFTNALERVGILDGFVKYYDESKIDMPQDYLLNLTGVEARVGKIQLNRYGRIVANRRQAAQFYSRQLEGIPNMQLPPLVEGATYSHFVPRVADREELMTFAFKRGVQLGKLIEYSIPSMVVYRDRPGSRFEYPIAEHMARSTVNLPIHSADERKLAKVVEVILAYDQSHHLSSHKIKSPAGGANADSNS